MGEILGKAPNAISSITSILGYYRIRTPVTYPDSSYGSEMHVCTLTHSGLLHASGLSAVSWLTAWLDLELQVRAYVSTTAVLRAY